MTHQAILLPGAVLPGDLAYGDLLEALGEGVDACAKDLELYVGDTPPSGYGLELEIAGVARVADEAGFERFHLVGYSGGGAICAAFTALHPEAVQSLSLLEPAWVGNDAWSESEREVWDELDRIMALPERERMPHFVRVQLAPGVPPPPPPSGDPPPWMAKRPAGIEAITSAFKRYDLDLSALRGFRRPVYFALGGSSNPGYYGAMAERLGEVFPDYTVDVYDGRHHFDPPHRVEPGRLAARLRAIWDRASGTAA